MEYTEPSLTELEIDGVRIRVLHEYDNHPTVSGNKWWKLKPNLERARSEGHDTILTFGGPYSNHIYATAAAAKAEGFKSIGIIRGEEVSNPVLDFAKAQGMKLRFISREAYRLKEITDQAYVIPEGGTNEYAVQSCEEWGQKLNKLEFDEIYVAVGTGGTIGGLIRGIDKMVVGVPVLRNNGFLDERIRGFTKKKNWKLLNDYHHGGYGKMPKELIDFCKTFPIEIEPVYTGKLFWAVRDQIKKGTSIIVIHTGGLPK